jgi:hypothetical protein
MKRPEINPLTSDPTHEGLLSLTNQDGGKLYTPEEAAEVLGNLAPREAFNHFYTDRPRVPRESAVKPKPVSLARFTDGKTPAELEESLITLNVVHDILDAAIESEAVVKLKKDTPDEVIHTTERAFSRYGEQLLDELDLPEEALEIAKIELGNAIKPGSEKIVDTQSFALGTIALAQMAERDQDDVEQQTAKNALRELPHDPNAIDRVRQTVSQNTGELFIQAVRDFELVDA